MKTKDGSEHLRDEHQVRENENDQFYCQEDIKDIPNISGRE